MQRRGSLCVCKSEWEMSHLIECNCIFLPQVNDLSWLHSRRTMFLCFSKHSTTQWAVVPLQCTTIVTFRKQLVGRGNSMATRGCECFFENTPFHLSLSLLRHNWKP